MPTILVVDDDAHIREVITFALAKAGFRTIEAADGQQALERFAREAPDLVVLDILMPELDQFKAFWEGREVVLTVTELGILRTLIERPGKVFSRDHLMGSAYESRTVVADRTIDSHVRRVRAKLRAAGGDPIETVHGAGYKLGPC